MIRHVVLCRLKEGVAGDDPRVAAVTQEFAKLGPLLSEAARPLGWETHDGIGTTAIAAQLAMVCDFPDVAALEAYQADPEHRKVAGRLREVFDLSSADYVH